MAAEAQERRIRVGVLLDGLTVDHWVASILRQVAEAPFCDLALFVLNDEPRPPRSLRSRLGNARSHGLFKLYNALDSRIYGAADDAFAPVALEPEFDSVPRLRVVPLRPKRFEHRFDEQSLAAVRDADLDVILRFGFNIIRGEILTAARHGVWSFHHGDNREYRGGPAFFWEMFEGNPVSGTILQLLTDELDGGRVLYRSWAATDVVSLRRGRNAAFWKSSHFVIRRLRDLHERGFDHIAAQPGFVDSTPYEKPIYRTPTNGQMLRFAWRIGSGLAKRRLRRLVFREQWFIAFRRRRGEELPSERRDGFEVVSPPRDRFFADPFTVTRNGCEYVLFEDYDYGTGKGVISYLTLDERGPSEPRLALERDYHLSYPFTFERDGEVYMLPETSSARTIELYRAERVPDRWELVRVLMRDVDASDATLLEHDGLLWLFASIAVPGAATTDELFVFWSESLDGEWSSHPLNPVVSDVRRARPAGRVFRSGGELIRPAQDCSGRYGGALVLNRIDELSTTDYRESAIARLDGGVLGGALGIHTYNAGERHEVVDGLAARAKLALPPWQGR